MAINADNVIIQGDLSRNDVRVLVYLCSGRRVIEFGMGGSTLILARCAASLISYETDAHWFDVTRHRMGQIPDKTCEPTLVMSREVPGAVSTSHVLFVDGVMEQRAEIVMANWRSARQIVLHDSRAPETWQILQAFMADREAGLWIDSVAWHWMDSNMIIINKRYEPVTRDDWNVSEACDRRADWNTRDYVGIIEADSNGV